MQYQSIIVLQATGNYATDETVTGGTSNNTGVVVSWDSTRGILRLKDVSGAFTGHEVLTGALSGTTGLMAKTDLATATVDVVAFLRLKVNMYQKTDTYQKQQ